MTAEDVFEVVRASTAKVLDVDTSVMTMDGTLGDLGANSVDRADIVTQSMLDLRVKVPAREFKEVTDIRSLVGVLQSHVQ
jgi:polyketide biosynthesis acyl carrier protein